MGEERKSVLNQEEIDFVAGLIAEGKEDANDRILFTEQRGLLMRQRLSEIWDAWQNRKWDTRQSRKWKKWENVLNAISKIPKDIDLNSLMMANFPGKSHIGSIARVSIAMLLKDATSCLSVAQVKLVDDVLRRVNGDE